jgi:hypothetical protein
LPAKRRIEIDVRLITFIPSANNGDDVITIPRTKDGSQSKIRLWFDYSPKIYTWRPLAFY